MKKRSRRADAWAQRLAMLTWPAMVFGTNLVWARAARAMVALAVNRQRSSALPRLHHVQMAMPAGREAEARAFYGDLLGLEELDKPPALAVRGGCWFGLGDRELHLGVDPAFRPASKAHVALLVRDLAATRRRLEQAGVPTREDEPLAGYGRFYADDPFGNRVELLAPAE